jgi:hypothetical protein
MGDSAGASAKAGHGLTVAQAHARLLVDKTLQFDFRGPPKIHPPPPWLQGFAKFLEVIAPVLKWVVYGGLALAAVLLLLFLARELVSRRFPQWFKPKMLKDGPARAPEWRPDLDKAKVLMEDANLLAAQGRYAEAVRMLLFRTVDDLDGRHPHAVRPALTSRDLTALALLPPKPRTDFEVIVEVVERSFFGGRPVDAVQFETCRRAYEAFINPQAWA